jgi:acetolactate synthase-1/2/3 large subunit
VEQAARLIRASRRPVLLVGGGIHLSGAYAALQAFAEAHNIPVAHTISGKGAIACTHPLSAGVFGRYSRIANDLIATADLFIVVGCKLGEIATKRFQLLPAETPIVHLDIVAEEIGRTSRCDVPLWGDARTGLEDLDAALAGDTQAGRTERADYAAEVPARMRKWIAEARHRLESEEAPINMARLIHELNKAMPADGILVADGGFAGHWTGLLFDTKAAGRHFVPDRGFASIGYGLPGAMGAQLAAPGRQVVGITGDGGFNMTIGELETARRLGLPITLFVVNNAASGYVKALQHAMYGAGNYQSSDLVELDYAALARGFGCNGIRVEAPGDLAAAIRSAFAVRDRPTVVDVIVTRDPAKMLPAVDSRTLVVKKGDRPV